MEKMKQNSNIYIAKLFLKSIAYIIVLMLLFPACSDLVADIELPDTEPKIVAHSFICPADSAVMALLTWSNPINSNQSHSNPKIIENAVVKIAEKGGAFSNLKFYPERKLYSLSTDIFPIIAGKRYVLRVELPDGQSVEAECFVPDKNETLELKEAKVVQYNEYERAFQVEYSFNDNGSVETYYYSASYLDSRFFDYRTLEWVYYQEQLWPTYGNSYIHGKGEGPKTYLIRAETYLYNDEYEEVPYEDDRYVTLVLLQTDENYYKYHVDLEYYYPDDFFSEPIHIYSNVKGGRGVFAGYNKTELKVLVEID